jgi:hypothetical protein
MRSFLLEPLDDIEQMADRAREAVEADDDEDIAGADFVHQSGQLGPGPRGAGTMFLEDCFTADRVEFVGLRVVEDMLAMKPSGAGRRNSAGNIPIAFVGVRRQVAYRRRHHHDPRHEALALGAVDQNGFVLDVLVQSRRDRSATQRLMRKLLKKSARAPRVMITDKLK